MKKRNLVLLATLSSLLLSGCTKVVQEKYFEYKVDMGSVTSDKEGAEQTVFADELELNFHAKRLYVGENTQIEARVRPTAAYDSQITFTSSNENILTVNASGKVTAKATGEANVTVTVEGTDLVDTIEFVVLNKITSGIGNAIKDKLDALKAVQEQRWPDGAQKVVVNRNTCFETYRYANSNDYNKEQNAYLTYQSKGIEINVVDHNAGYFSIGGYDYKISTKENAPTRSSFSYAFKTNASYQTYVYHQSGDTKRYTSVNTSSFIGQNRFKAVEAVVDAFFNKGHYWADQPPIWALENDELDSSSLSNLSDAGYSEDGKYLSYSIHQQVNQTIGNDEESDYEVPAGTRVRFTVDISYTWKDGVIFSEDYCVEKKYTCLYFPSNQTEYMLQYQKINWDAHADDDAHYELPNDSDYEKVDSIMDL